MKPDFTLGHILDGYRSLSSPYLAERYLDQFIRDYRFDDNGAYLKGQGESDTYRRDAEGAEK